MKRVIKIVAGVIIGGMILGMVLSIPVVISGYNMYHRAVSKTSITDKVSEIRSDQDYVQLKDISDAFRKEIIHSEDRRFYSHPGFDVIAITRAVLCDIKAGHFVQGGSTITQQLAKNMYFANSRTLKRKVAEIIVAVQLEHRYTKSQILELYCNEIYYGQGCNGIKEATRHYYRVNPKDLSSEQAARLVYTIKCPECFNPAENSNYVGAAAR